MYKQNKKRKEQTIERYCDWGKLNRIWLREVVLERFICNEAIWVYCPPTLIYA